MDEIDLLILKEFCCLKENEHFTIWDLMKRLYPQVSGVNKDRKYDFLKKRIKRMAKLDLFHIESKRRVYTLISDKIYMKKFTFPCGRNKGIAILNQGKWIIFEL